MRRLMLLGLTLLGSASAQVTASSNKFALLHGLSDAPSRMVNAQMWLPRGSVALINQYDSVEQGVLQQAAQLNDELRYTAAAVGQPYALIGHSQGGLRARAYAQTLANANGRGQNLVGLMTIGSPNNGAPLVNNAPVMLNRIELNVALAGVGLFHVGQLMFTGTLGVGELPGTSLLYKDKPGVRDLSPDSEFFKTINDTRTTQANCRWLSSGWGWFTQWYQVCDTVPVPGNVPIPANTLTASVIGTNNELWSGFPEGVTYRNIVIPVATALGVGWSAAAFWTFGATLPMAAASWDLVYIAWNADSLWKSNVVGSQEGDLIVPKASQNIYAGNPNLGGRGKLVYEVPATHVSSQDGVDEMRHEKTKDAILEFSTKLNNGQ